jgi:flagellar hook-associated protein 3 FlgL
MRVSTAYFAQRGLTSMLEQQSRLADIQEQISSGKRLLRPSDDPTGAAQILRLEQALSVTNQYQRNADNALNRLTLQESTLDGVQDSLLRIREIAIQGANPIIGNTDRLALAQEVRERLSELVSLANTRDANQEYLFSGYKVTTKPISQAADGTFTYNGDQGQRALQISSGRQIMDSDSGNDVFVNIKNGNGTFQTNANALNNGTGVFDIGQVVDPTAYVAETYTITFVTNGNGNKAYNVVGSTSGQLIPPLPQNPVTNAPDYSDGGTIQFNGIQTGITGNPTVGDTFTVSPSTTQDMFTSVQKLVTALETTINDPSGQSDILNLINPALSEMDLAFDNVTRIRTSVGARLKTIDDQINVNEGFKIEMSTTLSKVRDLDIAEAAVELQSRLIALQAAQSTYTRIQGLSLFDHI